MKNKEELQVSMFALIERWQESGLSQKAFCKAEGVNYYRFKYWKTRRKQLGFQEEGGHPLFIPVSVPSTAKTYSGIELSFPNGVRLSIKENLGLSELKELINCF